MDNDNKVKKTEKKDKTKKTSQTKKTVKVRKTEKPKVSKTPHKTAAQKSKESIIAAAEEVIAKDSKNKNKNVIVPIEYSHELVHKEVTELLQNELTKISNDEIRFSFDIEKEYAKAKKNNFRFAWKNMWSRLFLCILVVLVITVVLTAIVIQSNKKIPVNVKGFVNVQLTELLDDVDKIESQIREAEEKIKEYETKRSEEIQKIEDTYSQEKEQIENKYNQEKRRAENIYSQETNKLDTKKTTGWMEGRNKNKELEKSKNKYDETIALAKKKRQDALNISRNKYRNDLPQAKTLYKTEIENCWNTISKLKEDRYRFDSDKIKLEAEYDGILKDKDILHKREMDNQKDEFSQKLFQQKNEYENRLASSARKLEETIAADIAHEKKRVEETINTYDPALLKDSRIKKIVKSANGFEYKVGEEDRISYLPREGASEIFKKTLESQKTYYEDLSYLASVYGQFPHKENRAIVTYVNAMKSLASKAGSEIYISSVAEVNRIIEEKNKIEFEKNNIIAQKNELQNDFNNILDVMCQEKSGDIFIDGIVTSISEKRYNVYVKESKRSVFSEEANKGKVFPCSLYREGHKVAIARIEQDQNKKFILTNIAINGSNIIHSGDRIVLEEPYEP